MNYKSFNMHRFFLTFIRIIGYYKNIFGCLDLKMGNDIDIIRNTLLRLQEGKKLYVLL